MRMRPIAVVFVSMGLLLQSALLSWATLLIEIDKSTQQMTVTHDGARLYTWPVSTGTLGYDTPTGAFTPIWMAREHFSREWDDAPMPHSIFFTKQGHAIHGTDHIRNIGRPASHGCVRLAPENAQVLFDLVKREGMTNTRVELTGSAPAASSSAVVRTPRNEHESGSKADQFNGPRRPHNAGRRNQSHYLPLWRPPAGRPGDRRTPPFYPGYFYGRY